MSVAQEEAMGAPARGCAEAGAGVPPTCSGLRDRRSTPGVRVRDGGWQESLAEQEGAREVSAVPEAATGAQVRACAGAGADEPLGCSERRGRRRTPARRGPRLQHD